MHLLEFEGLTSPTPKRQLKSSKLPCALYYMASSAEDTVQIKGRKALDCRGKNTAATVTLSVAPAAVYIQGNIC